MFDNDDPLADLLASLKGCLQRELGKETAVLFSGGLDSTLLTCLARPCSSLHLFTVGYPESHDLQAGRMAAEELDLPWDALLLDDGAVRAGVAALRNDFGLNDPVTISFELPLYIACSLIPHQVLLSGQGADELFGGYARYSDMDDDRKREAMDGDVRRLLDEGAPRERRIAGHFLKRLCCPYLCPEVVRVSQAFSTDQLSGPGGNKLPLRQLASELGLTASNAPKKAAQYGSGTMAAMKRMAAKDGVPVGRWVLEV